MTIERVSVHEPDEGSRLGKMVAKRFTLPFSTIAKFVRTGQIRVNGKRSSLNAKLKIGDEVRIPANEETRKIRTPKTKYSEFEKIVAKDLIKNRVYKDEHILVLNKPAGLAVQGGSKTRISVDSLSRLLKFGEERPRLVHRLDKDTSGILMLARTKSVARLLSAALKERTTHKTYIGILDGIPDKSEEVIESPLRKTYLPSEGFELVLENESGKPAVTKYKVIDSMVDQERRMSLVEFVTSTGRTHQIRAHSASIECPVLGDSKYAGDSIGSGPLFLHAWKMEVPLLDRQLKLVANLPGYFTAKLKSLNMTLCNE